MVKVVSNMFKRCVIILVLVWLRICFSGLVSINRLKMIKIIKVMMFRMFKC